MTRELSAKCPNHGCQLLDIGERGRGQCPVSSCIFDFEQDDLETQMKKEYQTKIVNGQYKKVLMGGQPAIGRTS